MPHNDRLFNLLDALDDKELQILWADILRCKPGQDDFATGSREWRLGCISKEWRGVHGHTLANLARSPHALPWKRILIDVADKLKPGLGWTHYRLDDFFTEEEIEADILRMHDERVRQAFEKLNASEREELAKSVDAHFRHELAVEGRATQGAGIRTVTVSSLGSSISAGLLTGAGAMSLMQGSGAAIVGGMLGGSLYQLGLWLVVRVFGMWSGAQLALSGGAAAVGGALLSAPAAAAFAANAVMSTAYRKTIPATLFLLTTHTLRKQLADLEG
jgi:uncharacterized protein YaaW (UPF0174 family)